MSKCKAHEVRVSQMSSGKHDNQQREVRVSSQQRHETRISKPKCESRVYSTERELRISEPCDPETYVSELRRKINIRSPRRLEACLFDPPSTDLRDYFTKKRSVHQITPQYCCERLITSMLSECQCSSHVSKQSVFNWLSSMPVSQSGKRCLSRMTRIFSDVEYPEVTVNIVGPSTTPSKTKRK